MKRVTPTGLEQLLDRAARDSDFAAELLRDRRLTLERSALRLSDGDRSILETVDDRRLEQMILSIRSSLEAVERRSFLLGAVGAAVVLGSGAAGCEQEREPRRSISFGLTAAEPPTVQIIAEQIDIEGALDADAVRRIVLRHVSEVWHVDTPYECLQMAQRKAGIPLGATLVLRVDSDGRVRSAQTAIKRPEDGLLAKCFNKAPMQWRLPRPANGAAATVTIRLVAKLR